ncbi:MAG: cytochrome c oxidase subunit 3 [Ancalomicrobiaceae bacterium]|nr:cytochrome c oxidase subunit 3 [Ancalomicrobiaceae bacterium]
MADAHTKHHDYHLVDPSPWPLIAGVGAFITAIGAIGLFRWKNGDHAVIAGLIDLAAAGPWLFLLGLAIVLFTFYGWWSDVIREAHEGYHTRVVSLHLRYGMIMFIASEVMFFVAWFWAFFNFSLFPHEAIQYTRTDFLGNQWPPVGIETLNPWHLPLVNTLILLLSGTTVTWAHHALLHDDRDGLKRGLFATIVLGVCFTSFQAYEYSEAHFHFAGHIYGSTFFMATGFHGFHVIVGTIFLTVCLIRAYLGDFTPKQHFGFEAAAWYWHFVDVVWLFLFTAIYIWGSSGGHPVG